jgi:hypothetical protein
MATINLGAIKFNWKGAYSGATAYVVDDVVSYNGASYICTATSTGNLPTDTNFWDQMSSAGTDGTDLTSTLTTQGDIVYRDASGLQRLGAGTSGQVLQTNGTGANPSWGTVSSDYVKLASVDSTSITASSYNFQEFVDETLYNSYVVKGYYILNRNGYRLETRFLNGTTPYTAGEYRWGGYRAYVQSSGVGPTVDTAYDQGTGRIVFTTWGSEAYFPVHFNMNFTINNATNVKPSFLVNAISRDDSGTYYIFQNQIGGYLDNSGNVDGLQFSTSDSGAIGTLNLTIWGLKK